MVNYRESEIRDESLSLTVTAYALVNSLSDVLPLDLKNRLLDESFNLSSRIAEAFRTNHNDNSESEVQFCLERLVSLRALAETYIGVTEASEEAGYNFTAIAANLEIELRELLLSIQKINSEDYTPKLELACI